MTSKAKVNKLFALAQRTEKENAGDNFISRFNAARERGMVLCKDGKERTISDWLDTLKEPGLKEKILLVVSEKRSPEEWQESQIEPSLKEQILGVLAKQEKK
jgi:hypothetical protein